MSHLHTHEQKELSDVELRGRRRAAWLAASAAHPSNDFENCRAAEGISCIGLNLPLVPRSPLPELDIKSPFSAKWRNSPKTTRSLPPRSRASSFGRLSAAAGGNNNINNNGMCEEGGGDNPTTNGVLVQSPSNFKNQFSPNDRETSSGIYFTLDASKLENSADRTTSPAAVIREKEA